MKIKHGLALVCAASIMLSGCMEVKPMQINGSNSQSSSSDAALSAPEIPEYTHFSGTIPAGRELCVSDGQALLISEKVVCENDGAIRIEKGGLFDLCGEIELSGDLYVDGTLKIGENAKIYGTGTIHVINSFDDISCSGTVTAKIKAPEPVEKDGVTYVGDILIVNKKYALPKNYGDGLSDELSAAIRKMRRDSGFTMSIISGFRSYETQTRVFNNWCSIDGIEAASTYSAAPGHSEHQAGLAADITSCESSYANTDEAHWLAENCYKYGLIIRYPKDKVDITKYIYEPWHVRYVGKSNAKLIHDSGLCLEEFLQVEG